MHTVFSKRSCYNNKMLSNLMLVFAIFLTPQSSFGSANICKTRKLEFKQSSNNFDGLLAPTKELLKGKWQLSGSSIPCSKYDVSPVIFEKSDESNSGLTEITTTLPSGTPVDSDVVFRDKIAGFAQIYGDKTSMWLTCRVTRDGKKMNCLAMGAKNSNIKPNPADAIFVLEYKKI